jgi:hypothetical protein
MTTSDKNPKDGEYEPTAKERAGIERGLRAAAEGRFATDQQVEAVFAKFRWQIATAPRNDRGSSCASATDKLVSRRSRTCE